MAGVTSHFHPAPTRAEQGGFLLAEQDEAISDLWYGGGAPGVCITIRPGKQRAEAMPCERAGSAQIVYARIPASINGSPPLFHAPCGPINRGSQKTPSRRDPGWGFFIFARSAFGAYRLFSTATARSSSFG